MSVINIISNEEVTLVQGVNGLFLYEESWVSRERRLLYEESRSLNLSGEAEVADTDTESGRSSPRETGRKSPRVNVSDLF